MALKAKDFIEIEFVGKLKDGNVFDSNIAEELERLNPKAKAKPFIFSLGQDMFLKGIDNFLIGKEIGDYEIELSSENAFGKRDSKQVQIVPIKVFKAQNINPVVGTSFNFDGKVGKVLTSSGGRVIVDFNNPLAGKDVIYKIKVKRIVTDIKEKVKAFLEFLFRQDFDFDVKEEKVVVKAPKGMDKFMVLFKDKFKEVIGLDLEAEEISEKNEENKPKESQN